MGRRTDWAASSSERDVPSVAAEASRSTSTATLPPPQPTNAAVAHIESQRFMLLPPGLGTPEVNSASGDARRQAAHLATAVSSAAFEARESVVPRPVDRYRCSMANGATPAPRQLALAARRTASHTSGMAVALARLTIHFGTA